MNIIATLCAFCFVLQFNNLFFIIFFSQKSFLKNHSDQHYHFNILKMAENVLSSKLSIDKLDIKDKRVLIR